MRLMLGDCLELMKEIPSGSVDLVLCDLPYGTTACKWDAVIPFEPLWTEYRRICKNEVVLTASEPFATALRGSNLREYKYDWYWLKNIPTGFACAATQPMRVIENICVFYTSSRVFNKHLVPTRISDRKVIDGRKNGSGSNGSNHVALASIPNIQKSMVNPRNILEFNSVPNAGGHKLHPTQKPVALMEYLIRTYTNPGDRVLDNTMGSGTTGVACANTGRDFIGIERDPAYFAIAEKRIREAELNNL